MQSKCRQKGNYVSPVIKILAVSKGDVIVSSGYIDARVWVEGTALPGDVFSGGEEQ